MKIRSRLVKIVIQKDGEERVVFSHLVEKLKPNSNPKATANICSGFINDELKLKFQNTSAKNWIQPDTRIIITHNKQQATQRSKSDE